MGYLDELADPEVVSPLQTWDPKSQKFPLPFDSTGPIAGASKAINRGIWSVHQAECIPSWGFKIHVAPKMDEFDEVLAMVDAVCQRERIGYKNVRNREVLWALYSKNVPVVHAGKGITIYPDETNLDRLLEELYAVLGTKEGPSIYGDFQLGESILHVRYGAFRFDKALWVTEGGDPVILGPDKKARTDLRSTVPCNADFQYLPSIFRRIGLKDSPALPSRYKVQAAIASHAGGGVYTAFDQETGKKVILKRGVAFLGLDSAGLDARARLMHEQRVLSQLNDLDLSGRVPRLLGSFKVENDFFLVEEFLEGRTLAEWTAVNNPVYKNSYSSSSSVERIPDYYISRVSKIESKLHNLIEELRGASVVHNDLQPGNVLVAPDGAVSLIDFEGASCGASAERTGMQGVPWVYGRDRKFSTEADHSAVHRLSLYCKWPVVGSGHLGKDVDSRFQKWMLRRQASHEDLYNLLRSHTALAADWKKTGRGLTLSERTPESFQWISALGFGKGILGALFVRTPDVRVEESQQKILTVYEDIPKRRFLPHELGYVDGGGMIPAVLSWRKSALATGWSAAYVDSVQNTDLEKFSWRLDRGIAGILLSLHGCLPTPGLQETKEQVLSLLRSRVLEWLDKKVVYRNDDRGLFGGTAGVAFALATVGDPSDIVLAQKLLWLEAETYQEVSGGLYFTDETNRYRPYFDRGNAGLLVAALKVLPPDDINRGPWPYIARGLSTGLAVEPGLSQGTAGMLAAARVLYSSDNRGLIPESILSGLESDLLSCFIHTHDGLVIPGQMSRRVSLDGIHGLGGSVPVACASKIGDLFNVLKID